MKQIIFLSLMVLSNLTYGQVQLKSSLCNPDYFLYNNAMDTLYLTKIHVGDDKIATSKIFDTIQLDGLGSKEIIFERRYTGSTRDIKQVSQTFERTEIHKYEIWNLDTKTLIFEAVDVYKFNYNNWDSVFPDSLNNRSKGICSYKYDFTIDNKGLISISNLKYENVANNCIADKKEGNYTFINGKYTYE